MSECSKINAKMLNYDIKCVGIIAEYNPFHNGHLYQLRLAKQLTSADYVVVVMSGSFVQRGTPAFLDKLNRTRMALENGADLVLELPVRYAVSSAEYFSSGAVSLLNNIGIVDSLCFGSECGNLAAMKEIAEFIQKDCDEFNKDIALYTKNGLSYPQARQRALLSHCNSVPEEILLNIISSPNNILGIEYLKSLLRIQSTIEPITIERKQTGYHDPSLEIQDCKETSIHSATAIRGFLEKQEPFHKSDIDKRKESLQGIAQSVPDNVYKLLCSVSSYPIHADNLSDMLYFALSTYSLSELASYQDMTPELANAIKKNLIHYESYQQFALLLKSKQYTYTRICRCMLHILLGIKTYSLEGQTSERIAPYARILGFRQEASTLLRQMKKTSRIPVITKMADAKHILASSAYEMLKEDIFATDLYHRLVYQSFQEKRKNDIQTTPVII